MRHKVCKGRSLPAESLEIRNAALFVLFFITSSGHARGTQMSTILTREARQAMNASAGNVHVNHERLQYSEYS